MPRARHAPTVKSRTQVSAHAETGVPHHDIAKLVSVSIHTLLKHYRSELDVGKAKANAKISKRLYQLAMKGNLAACIFWLKSQAGWRETNVVQNQQLDKDGKPTDAPAPVQMIVSAETVKAKMEELSATV